MIRADRLNLAADRACYRAMTAPRCNKSKREREAKEARTKALMAELKFRKRKAKP